MFAVPKLQQRDSSACSPGRPIEGGKLESRRRPSTVVSRSLFSAPLLVAVVDVVLLLIQSHLLLFLLLLLFHHYLYSLPPFHRLPIFTIIVIIMLTARSLQCIICHKQQVGTSHTYIHCVENKKRWHTMDRQQREMAHFSQS